MKCNFCRRKAIRITMLYKLNNKSNDIKPYHTKAVCERHYLEFQQGICTVKCPSCKKETLIKAGDYYEDKPKYCCHCTMLIMDR
jgi:hypothetical protein